MISIWKRSRCSIIIMIIAAREMFDWVFTNVSSFKNSSSLQHLKGFSNYRNTYKVCRVQDPILHRVGQVQGELPCSSLFGLLANSRPLRFDLRGKKKQNRDRIRNFSVSSKDLIRILFKVTILTKVNDLLLTLYHQTPVYFYWW